MERWLNLVGVVLVAVLACACCVASPVSGFEVKPGSFTLQASSDQAGAHADLTTSFAFKQDAAGGVGALLRNAEVVLPVGFAGYPASIKTCAPAQLEFEKCPADAQVGTIEVVLRLLPGDNEVELYPVYNMAPPANETAVYGFVVAHIVSGNLVISLGPDYRVHATASNVVTGFELLRQSLTLWGVPAAPSHDAQRGSNFNCRQSGPSEYFVEGQERCEGGGVSADEDPLPYLVNPTQCTGTPLTAELKGVESWEGEPALPTEADLGPFTGCASLKFTPTIALAPEVPQATSPSGYEFDLRVPQTEGAETLATSDLKDVVLRMPAGVVLSPSAGTGLVSCSEAQVGLGSGQHVECPAASKLGSVSVITPALTGELKGALYLGGPPSGVIAGSPFTVYLTFEGHGVLVKIRGTATANPATGQITTVFDENPELPFSELKLHLNGGSRATLANPSTCGSYFAQADLTPWSSPFIPDATPTSAPFQITGCGAPRFAPVFAAGTLSTQAGGYSAFRVKLSREDADQQLGGLTVTTPPGLSGNLSGVPLCQEPQAAEGVCPAASQIGEVTAAAGPGPEPVFIKGGRVFLTGPYEGAPFGLSIDVAEKAGPIDLGSGSCDCEVVRAIVSVDLHTGQLTVTNGALPVMKDGIPFQVKSVDVDINRPNFIFNPTNCNPLAVHGAISSTQGMTASVESRFQVTNCAALAFKPSFTASTQAKTSKTNGASLSVKLTYPSAPLGSETNIAKVKVELPKLLPSRLTTLQQACLAKQFEADPAGCPAASVVGQARATTPTLPVPLEGPAYFVSHGGEAFPSLIVVLQGYGVTVDLVGSTFISKSGITSSTFNTVPDIPVGSFELTLPEGRFSALAANADLCNSKLVMPTEVVAQDGAEIHQSTPIRVTSCGPVISVEGHSVRGAVATITVSVPEAGRVVASGEGISQTSITARAAGSVTARLILSQAKRALLARHPGRRLTVHVKLRFIPRHGAPLATTTTVLFG